jgi:predicted phage replisome organizer
MNKKFWLKLSAHFFDDDEMIYLESQENGYKYITLWQKILLKCLKEDNTSECGFLRFNEKIPYTAELLSKVIRMDIDTVRVGIEIFKKLGMIEILENGTYYIESVQKLIGKESESAERVRKHREKKALQCNGMKQICNDNIEVEVKKNKKETEEKNIIESELYQKVKNAFYKGYEEVYKEKPSFNEKEFKQIKLIIQKAKNIDKDDIESVIVKKLKILYNKSKGATNDYYGFTPGKLLCRWNELVEINTEKEIWYPKEGVL